MLLISKFAESCEKGNRIMADKHLNETTRILINSVQETNKAIAETAVSAQEKNLAFAQNVLENGIEVLKWNAESTRTLMQDLVEQARKQRVGPEGFQALVESTIEAQERNTKFAQSTLENGLEVLKSQLDLTHSLIQELEQQYQKQQEAFQALAQESIDAYRDFIFAPLNFFQKAMSTAEAATSEGLENFQKMTQQSMKNIQKATVQVTQGAEKATRQAPHHTQKTAKQKPVE